MFSFQNPTVPHLPSLPEINNISETVLTLNVDAHNVNLLSPRRASNCSSLICTFLGLHNATVDDAVRCGSFRLLKLAQKPTDLLLFCFHSTWVRSMACVWCCGTHPSTSKCTAFAAGRSGTLCPFDSANRAGCVGPSRWQGSSLGVAGGANLSWLSPPAWTGRVSSLIFRIRSNQSPRSTHMESREARFVCLQTSRRLRIVSRLSLPWQRVVWCTAQCVRPLSSTVGSIFVRARHVSCLKRRAGVPVASVPSFSLQDPAKRSYHVVDRDHELSDVVCSENERETKTDGLCRNCFGLDDIAHPARHSDPAIQRARPWNDLFSEDAGTMRFGQVGHQVRRWLRRRDGQNRAARCRCSTLSTSTQATWQLQRRPYSRPGPH